MSEGTVQPQAVPEAAGVFDVECTMGITAAEHRKSLKVSEFPQIATLKNLFAEVKVLSVEAEFRQANDDVKLSGHIYAAIIPTKKDTDAVSGGSPHIVNNVPRKQTFPLDTSRQSNMVFHFDLSGFELDVAQDPRRGAGPVVWMGNSGVTIEGASKNSIAIATWRVKVACSGKTALWL